MKNPTRADLNALLASIDGDYSNPKEACSSSGTTSAFVEDKKADFETHLAAFLTAKKAE